jgi:hypothetical protein
VIRALAIAAALVTGCVPTSQIGPYVRSVQRQGAWLVVQKCMIVLEGDDLNESNCTVENLPLGSVPMGPPMGPPPGPPMQPTPSR